MYWVGSDIAIKKSHPTYYRPWNAKPFLTFEQRIDTVLTVAKARAGASQAHHAIF